MGLGVALAEAGPSRNFDVPWVRAPVVRHSVCTCHRRFAMAESARLRIALLWVYWLSLFLCVGSDYGLPGCWNAGLFSKWFPQRLGGNWIRQGTKAPHPRAGAHINIRGELNTSRMLDEIREKNCVGAGCMGILEEGHGRVSKGVLETAYGLQKTEKERESGGWTRIKSV